MLCSYFANLGIASIFACGERGGLLGAIDCAIIIGGCLGMGRDALGRGGMHVLILVFEVAGGGEESKGGREIDSVVGVSVQSEDVGVDGARRMYCLIGF